MVDLTDKNAVHQTGCALWLEDWRKGKNLFFNDWITDKRCFKAAMKFVTRDMFPNQTAVAYATTAMAAYEK